jgi:hypothetical protein
MVRAIGRAHTDWEIEKEKMWPFKGTRREGGLKGKCNRFPGLGEAVKVNGTKRAVRKK